MATCSIIWVDALVNMNENHRHTQQRLRAIKKHVMIFKDREQCENHIRSVSSDKQLMLIVSEELGQELVPHIYQLQQIASVYIYSVDKNQNEEWKNLSSKIQVVVTCFDELIGHIESAKKSQVLIVKPKPIKSDLSFPLISIVNDDPFDSPIAFIECFIRMEPSPTEVDECIASEKAEHKNNSAQLVKIKEFQEAHSPGQALWWYTRQSFICRMLMTAVRQQSIRLLFLLRFWIRDIDRQLKDSQCHVPM
ncbi:unnamed protein product [Rotaria sordida]|uniref:Uncharacterized protein n=1 Tax=Rotaria sordida TaxID=392033 RepID=A0A818KAC4_9BILA|nr:unnamed protein product [Rotaria sordida]